MRTPHTSLAAPQLAPPPRTGELVFKENAHRWRID
jgi:hypothetical protein